MNCRRLCSVCAVIPACALMACVKACFWSPRLSSQFGPQPLEVLSPTPDKAGGCFLLFSLTAIEPALCPQFKCFPSQPLTTAPSLALSSHRLVYIQ